MRLKKNILMVAYTNYEYDARVIREAEAAVGAGFDVDFLSLGREGAPEVEVMRGVRVIRLRQHKFRGNMHLLYVRVYLEFFFRCFFRITHLFLRRRYCAIHVNNMPDFLVFSTIIPKLLGSKILLDIHDPMPNTFVSKYKGGENGIMFKLLLWQERLSAWYVDQVLTVHDPVKIGILDKHRLPVKSIEVIANFADDELFKVVPYPAFDGRVRFVYHGSILERSGLRTLALAAAQLRNRDKILIRIIGGGDFATELKRLLDSFHLAGTVDFANRAFSNREIPDMVADCHCGLIPLDISSATNYALPLKLMEYVSMGMPVVTVQNEAIKYYFSSEDCIYFRAGDVESLRSVLDQLAEHPEVLNGFRERALAIREKFLWSKQKRKYIEMLRRLTKLS